MKKFHPLSEGTYLLVMNKIILALVLLFAFRSFAQSPTEKLSYHSIKVDEKGLILPWYSADPSEAYDHIVRIVWDFWYTMRRDPNGLPYYMNHQVWTKDQDDHRGIGGDQIAMAMSSWRLLYQYLGDERLVNNIRFMADYYLTHSLTPVDSKWPNIPYPYNTFGYSGIYDGDMILGKDFAQPDKAGSFGIELVNLYKMTGNKGYLSAAVNIANTLAEKTIEGDQDNSPLPFRVNAITGKTGSIREGLKNELKYSYTSNWTGTLQLFNALDEVGIGNREQYRKSFQMILSWMKTYPAKINKWGPFFEDVGEWSDTQINAVTFACFILENPQYFEKGDKQARSILDWVYQELGNDKWKNLGAKVVNEQTDYRVPGNSHTARQGAAELLYALKTGDDQSKSTGIRQLNWATYMVKEDGESTYPNNETWMTDGYGDFVRHYLRAISYYPELSPADQNHLVSSTSVVKKLIYSKEQIKYETFDSKSTETLRLISRPKEIKSGDTKLIESDKEDVGEYWNWQPLDKGGILKISHQNTGKIVLIF